ncbi:MAG TPA: alanine racemase [Acidimicrobiales bacterium]|nr:alanine racemase [Acidimicrobiales bacterium]
MNVLDLETPTLVIDLDRVEFNIAHMASLARDAGVRLRPHTKTHKMPEIARLQVAAGASGITCAKLGEAEVMVEAGFDDILLAYPLYGREKLARLARLRERARIQVSLDSIEVALGLAQLGVTAGDPVEVYVEVDTGLHRTGALPGEPAAQLVARLADLKGLRVVGLMTHAGHAYGTSDANERRRVVAREMDDLRRTRALCAEAGVELGEISVGSTPSVRDEIASGIATEVRPGTYVFNDTTMIAHGVATPDTCAAHVLATVVSRPTEDRFVLDAGSKCLTSENVGRSGWIQVVGRDDLVMDFVSEEHGVGHIDLERGAPLAIGDKVRLIPSHVCPVVNLFDSVTTSRGERVEGRVAVSARGRVL